MNGNIEAAVNTIKSINSEINKAEKLLNSVAYAIEALENISVGLATNSDIAMVDEQIKVVNQ